MSAGMPCELGGIDDESSADRVRVSGEPGASDLRTGRIHDRADSHGADAGADGFDKRVREVAIRRVLDPCHRPVWPATRGWDEPGIGHAREVGRHQHDARAPDEARCRGQTCAGAADDGDTLEWCAEQGRAGASGRRGCGSPAHPWGQMLPYCAVSVR